MTLSPAVRSLAKLSQRSSKTQHGGRLYVGSRRFSVGAYPDRSAKRSPKTLRIEKQVYYDGEAWRETWGVDEINQGASPYGLVNSSKSSTPSPEVSISCGSYKRRKADTKGIPAVAKRRIANMVCCLYRDYGRENLGFATLTLPPLSPHEMQRVNESYGKLNQRCMEKLKRKVERRGGAWLAVSAYEIQEKRFERWGTIALHTHCVYRARADKKSGWWLSIEDWESAWADTLESFLGHPIKRDALTNVQSARADLAFELAKYQTKGSEVIAKVNSLGRGSELPGQWWSASKDLKKIDRENTWKMSSEQVEYLMAFHHQLQDGGYLRARPICISYEEKEIQVGLAGFFVNDVAMCEFLLISSRGDGLVDATVSDEFSYERLQLCLVAALAIGNFEEVERLVELIDSLYPDENTKNERDRNLGKEIFKSTCRDILLRKYERYPEPLELPNAVEIIPGSNVS